MLGILAAPLLRAYCAPRAARFAQALDDVRAAQRALLARIVRAAAATGYGRSLGLAADDDLAAFRAKVPPSDYAAFAPWIDAQRRGEVAALAPGRTRCYETTSGSAGAAKHIPYNDALLGAFRGMFAVWAHDLLTHALRPRSGRAFVSVSPPIEGREGFADDRDYLGAPLRALVGRFVIAAPRLREPAAFRDALACALVAAGDLEIVSVWNPGYLLVLLEHFEVERGRLLPLLPASRRAVLARDPIDWRAVWPALQLVSCWTGAAAAAPSRLLAQRLPHALLQGKGLLATEAPVTVPLVAAGGCVPLVDMVFIELEDDAGSLHLLGDVAAGAEYSVVVTQAGGLLRYRLGDRVRVTGRHRDAPLLEFVGRADGVCDLVGEKLGEAFVARVLAQCARPGAYCTLLPLLPQGDQADRPRYCLLTDDCAPDLCGRVDDALMAAFRYREARTLGQLGPVEAIALPGMRRAMLDALTACGMKAGDIKDRALMPEPDRARRVRTIVAQRVSA